MKAKKRSGRQVAKENAEDESDDLMDVKPLEAFATGASSLEEAESDSDGMPGPESQAEELDSESRIPEGEAGDGDSEDEELELQDDGDSEDEELELQDDEFELEDASEGGGSDRREPAEGPGSEPEGAGEGVEGSESEGQEGSEEGGAPGGITSDEEGPSISGRGKEGKTLSGAFAEILAHPGPANKKDKAPILLGSKSVAKRRREEVETTAAQRAAKKLRQEMKQRGHAAVFKKGEVPASDAQEKVLYKIATRGVVQLFNAVSKAQRAQKDALAAGAKAKDAKINKSTFFQELRGKGAQATVPGGKKGGITIGPQEDVEGRGGKHGKGWDVLKDDFAGLQGSSSTKMKDWDKAVESDDVIDEAMSGSESEGLGDW